MSRRQYGPGSCDINRVADDYFLNEAHVENEGSISKKLHLKGHWLISDLPNVDDMSSQGHIAQDKTT